MPSETTVFEIRTKKFPKYSQLFYFYRSPLEKSDFKSILYKMNFTHHIRHFICEVCSGVCNDK